ncbi:hypothetical protein DKB98_07995 [Enterococcus faecalis]|nr:hypothetical protein [Enterococcus faecalis]EGO8437768.1 hypothetical protein [Enterococcus faecalis]EGO8545552.1 hypothetical protein [Enterococcus faecalis]EGO8610503.1 hypothetical protein [Enterococcus faecalis]EGO8977011.1 hypothetical protein [Enterococcus faecalis]
MVTLVFIFYFNIGHPLSLPFYIKIVTYLRKQVFQRKAVFDFLANLRIIEKMVHLNLDYCKYKIRGARYGKQKEETTI